MKKLLFGLLMLVSLTSYAKEDWVCECSANSRMGYSQDTTIQVSMPDRMTERRVETNPNTMVYCIKSLDKSYHTVEINISCEPKYDW